MDGSHCAFIGLHWKILTNAAAVVKAATKAPTASKILLNLREVKIRL
jgi:hypothetical protein